MNMETFSEADRFNYDPDPDDEAFSGILEIHVHHARNIHNICIYDKQDVYAKFSLTYNPDDAISTRIVNGGGKNPDFNDDLIIDVNQPDAVLKCEIWMLSRAKNLMDDQLLGFVLVPISSIYGKGTLSQDFHLSSTDLFHSPAGTIKLSLFLNAKTPCNPIIIPAAFPHSSAASQLLLSHKKISDDYCRIEFPDISVVHQNRQMVSEYFAKNGAPLKPWLEKPDGSFLHLGAAPQQLPVEDYEMAANSSDEFAASLVSPDDSSIHNSTMTSLSDERNSAESVEKKGVVFADFSTSSNENASSSPEKSNECLEEKGRSYSGKDYEDKEAVNVARQVKVEAEESAMQQQIVDMYMRSMQQFTESLAKMQLPMDLDKGGGGKEGDVVQDLDKKTESEKKKDGCRVFYGSRAFF